MADGIPPLSPRVSIPAGLVRLLAERFGIERRAASAELARRERVLLHWLAQGITSREAVRQAVAAYRSARSRRMPAQLLGEGMHRPEPSLAEPKRWHIHGCVDRDSDARNPALYLT